MTPAACFHCGRPVDGQGHRVRVGEQERTVCSEACARTAGLIASRGLTEFYRFRDHLATNFPHL